MGKRKRKRKNDKTEAERDEKKQFFLGELADKTTVKKQKKKNSAPSFQFNVDLVMAEDIAEHKPKKRKKRDNDLLKELKEKEQKLQGMTKEQKEHALISKGFANSMKRIMGEKVKDNIKILKINMRKKAAKKKRSQKEWKVRNKKVRLLGEVKQLKRKTNLGMRGQQKIAKNLGERIE